MRSWETIDQQGATEDGVTFVDAYGPTRVRRGWWSAGGMPATPNGNGTF